MRDLDKLRQSVRGMEFDLDEFEKMLDAQDACIEEMAHTDEILQKQLDAQREVLAELVNSVESLQCQINSLKTQAGVPYETAPPLTFTE